MKKFCKTVAVFSIFSCTFLFFSCIKKAPEAQIVPVESTDEVPPEEEKIEEKATETFEPSLVLAAKTSLCLLGRDEKMHRISSLSKGASFSLLFSDGTPESLCVEGRNYLHAVWDSVDYWISGDDIASNCRLALVIKKSRLYADMDLSLSTDERNSPVPFGSIVAVSQKEGDCNSSACKIWYFDKKEKKTRYAYIDADNISTRIDDIVVMQVVEDLRITKRATPRNELFKKAAKYNPCEAVLACLEAEKTEKIENNYQDVLNALPGARYKVNVKELMTVDQSKDPFQ